MENVIQIFWKHVLTQLQERIYHGSRNSKMGLTKVRVMASFNRKTKKTSLFISPRFKETVLRPLQKASRSSFKKAWTKKVHKPLKWHPNKDRQAQSGRTATLSESFRFHIMWKGSPLGQVLFVCSHKNISHSSKPRPPLIQLKTEWWLKNHLIF